MGTKRAKTRFYLGILALLGLTSTLGCSIDGHEGHSDPVDRVLPPPSTTAVNTQSTLQALAPLPIQAAPNVRLVSLEQPKPAAESLAQPREAVPVSEFHQTLNLPSAIDLAFRTQPRLKAALENIEQARNHQDIAFSAFLPLLTAGYSVGKFDVDVGGTGIPVGGSPYVFLSPGAALPVGLNAQPDYELAEIKLQWLVCDFGRRMGKYHQAGLAADIASLQTERAYQTVANEVTSAYYQLLRVRSLHRIAAESVHRATDDVDVAAKLARGGVIEREKLLRAQVALAQGQQLLDVAEEGEAIAIAALNLTIGINASCPTEVIDTTDIPVFTMNPADCLQTAVASRREFQVARKSIAAAQEGSNAARADFAPKIVAEGDLFGFDQSDPSGHAGLGLAFIKLEWGLFEGGRRVAEVRVEESKIREAMAQADSIADTIAFEVSHAYRQMIAARKGIDRSRPAVDQTLEMYRLVVARSRQGDATPSELTDAQAAVTRAQQDYFNAIYDYLTRLARLDYAMGTVPVPSKM